jgi:prophage maintenance system killer protein
MKIGLLSNPSVIMMKERKIFQPLLSSGICGAYQLLYKRGWVKFPITSDAEAKVDAVVANINASYFGTNSYETHEEKAVAYLYFLINDHPFTDGNKRTATLAFLMVCDFNGLDPKFENFTLDELAVFIEKTTADHRMLIHAIAKVLF